MLRYDPYRVAFEDVGGVELLMGALKKKINFQLQYQIIFAVWCMAFNPQIAERCTSCGLIQTLGDILLHSTTEKVIRIILATFVNILGKLEGEEKAEAARQMFHSKINRSLQFVSAKQYEDPDIQDDVRMLTTELSNCVV
ncbi:unnamed protein product [Caenorhabditis auriculariae]|uniref:ATPase V1 complex subunit H C-terminal domain-containing protein n=1 Tax=Caenorhabditis auriculariae TaxID=2777116 RepID=A0A8S1HSU2_9PELO|nr:unnamed protein product [Caenorhabditis auriculariae]